MEMMSLALRQLISQNSLKNLRICNIIILFLIIISGSSCTPQVNPEEVILEQKYRVDEEGDIIEDGYSNKSESYINDLRASHQKVDVNNQGSSGLRTFTYVLFLLGIIIVALPLILEKCEEVLLVNLINSSVLVIMLLMIIIFSHRIDVIFICSIFSVLCPLAVMYLLLPTSGQDRKKDPIKKVMCPNCAGFNFVVRDTSVRTLTGKKMEVKTFWCSDCNIGNSQVSESELVINEPVFNAEYLGKKLKNNFTGVTLKNCDGYTFLTSHALIIDDEVTYLGFNPDEKSLCVIQGVGVYEGRKNSEIKRPLKVTPLSSFRKTKDIDKVFDDVYCAKECLRADDKCNTNLCPKVRYKLRKSKTSDSDAENVYDSMKMLLNEVELDQCGKLCPFRKGESSLCNTEHCILKKLRNELL